MKKNVRNLQVGDCIVGFGIVLCIKHDVEHDVEYRFNIKHNRNVLYTQIFFYDYRLQKFEFVYLLSHDDIIIL